MILKIRQKIYAFVFWQTSLGEFFNKWYDLKLFKKYNFSNKEQSNKSSFEAHLVKEFHIVEKGLALKNPRPGFGKHKILNLISDTTKYVKLYGRTNISTSVTTALNSYLQFNSLHGEDLNNEYYQQVGSFIKDIGKTDLNFGGTKEMHLSNIIESTDINYKSFVETRVSVRDFSEKRISLNEIEEVIEIARFAPSVCNRQGWHVHAFTERVDIDKILEYQHGNRGFGHLIQALLIVTSDLHSFTKLEGNEPFIDGGIFSMSLLMAIHSKRMGACAMNTCIPYVDEIRLKNLTSIPENERVIMMIGMGKLKEHFKVPVSRKKNVREIFTFHSSLDS